MKERLRLTLRHGDTQHLAYLLQSSSVTPILFAMHGPSLIHLAASADDTVCVAILADNGVSVEALNVVDETPLATAVRHGSARAAKLLLKLGAGLESRTYLQTNPLHHAVKAKSQECVQLLLEHAAGQGLDVLRKVRPRLSPASIGRVCSPATPRRDAACHLGGCRCVCTFPLVLRRSWCRT